MKVALVTCGRFPTLTTDDNLLADALARRSVEVSAVVWNEPDVDWHKFDFAVVRSAWDYFHYPATFRRWIDDVSARTTLINTPVLLHWNLHKRYLHALERAGIDIVPTALIAQDAEPEFELILRDIGADEFVLKPAISAGAHRTYVFGAGHAEQSQGPAMLRALVRQGDVLVQPFLREIYDLGERSLIFIGGSFSHAVRRPPLSAGAVGGECRETRITPSPAEVTAALHALDALPAQPLYARVDLLPRKCGAIALTELEIIEPALYFSYHLGSADRFADAVLQGGLP